MALDEIRVLVVDDSAVIRSLIADSVAATPGMKVVGTAEDGQKALEILDAARPDVITLDVQMPRMDGLAALDAILARRPIPVIMVSSLTKLGAEIALDALDRGAVDYLAKPDYGAQTKAALKEDLPRKIRMAAGCDVLRILEIRRGNAGASPSGRAERAAGATGTRPARGMGRPRSCTRRVRKIESGCSIRVGRKMRCHRHFHGRSTGGWPSCSRPFGRPCRRSSSCSTCPRISRSRWPGGSIRSAICRSRRPIPATSCNPMTS